MSFPEVVIKSRPRPDYATLKPAITAVIGGTAVDVDWKWGGYRAFASMCEIQIDRADDAGWTLLAMDTTPATRTPTPSRPSLRNRNTAPSTTPATAASGNGVTRSAWPSAGNG